MGILKIVDAFNYYVHDIKIDLQTKVDDAKGNVILITPSFNDTIRTTIIKLLTNLYIILYLIKIGI